VVDLAAFCDGLAALTHPGHFNVREVGVVVFYDRVYRVDLVGKMSENIIAKFKCESVTKTHTGNKDEQGNLLQNETVNLSVVTSGKANVGWSRYTPWGKLEMAITNPGAQDKIKPGKNYKITIEEVSEDF